MCRLAFWSFSQAAYLTPFWVTHIWKNKSTCIVENLVNTECFVEITGLVLWGTKDAADSWLKTCIISLTFQLNLSTQLQLTKTGSVDVVRLTSIIIAHKMLLIRIWADIITAAYIFVNTEMQSKISILAWN